MNGDFTYQYRNLQRINDVDGYEGPGNGGQQGILELAWLMGTNNDVQNVQAQYQEFQGTDTTQNPPPDIFFVVHFHVDHVFNDPNNDNGQYLGIYSWNAFVSSSEKQMGTQRPLGRAWLIRVQHGQYVNNENRVDGNARSSRNARTILAECPSYAGFWTADEYFYPGYDTDDPDDEASVFLQYLFNQNLLTRNSVLEVSICHDKFLRWMLKIDRF